MYSLLLSLGTFSLLAGFSVGTPSTPQYLSHNHQSGFDSAIFYAEQNRSIRHTRAPKSKHHRMKEISLEDYFEIDDYYLHHGRLDPDRFEEPEENQNIERHYILPEETTEKPTTQPTISAIPLASAIHTTPPTRTSLEESLMTLGDKPSSTTEASKRLEASHKEHIIHSTTSKPQIIQTVTSYKDGADQSQVTGSTQSQPAKSTEEMHTTNALRIENVHRVNHNDKTKVDNENKIKPARKRKDDAYFEGKPHPPSIRRKYTEEYSTVGEQSGKVDETKRQKVLVEEFNAPPHFEVKAKESVPVSRYTPLNTTTKSPDPEVKHAGILSDETTLQTNVNQGTRSSIVPKKGNGTNSLEQFPVTKEQVVTASEAAHPDNLPSRNVTNRLKAISGSKETGHPASARKEATVETSMILVERGSRIENHGKASIALQNSSAIRQQNVPPKKFVPAAKLPKGIQTNVLMTNNIPMEDVSEEFDDDELLGNTEINSPSPKNTKEGTSYNYDGMHSKERKMAKHVQHTKRRGTKGEMRHAQYRAKLRYKTGNHASKAHSNQENTQISHHYRKPKHQDSWEPKRSKHQKSSSKIQEDYYVFQNYDVDMSRPPSGGGTATHSISLQHSRSEKGIKSHFHERRRKPKKSRKTRKKKGQISSPSKSRKVEKEDTDDTPEYAPEDAPKDASEVAPEDAPEVAPDDAPEVPPEVAPDDAPEVPTEDDAEVPPEDAPEYELEDIMEDGLDEEPEDGLPNDAEKQRWTQHFHSKPTYPNLDLSSESVEVSNEITVVKHNPASKHHNAGQLGKDLKAKHLKAHEITAVPKINHKTVEPHVEHKQHRHHNLFKIDFNLAGDGSPNKRHLSKKTTRTSVSQHTTTTHRIINNSGNNTIHSTSKIVSIKHKSKHKNVEPGHHKIEDRGKVSKKQLLKAKNRKNSTRRTTKTTVILERITKVDHVGKNSSLKNQPKQDGVHGTGETSNLSEANGDSAASAGRKSFSPKVTLKFREAGPKLLNKGKHSGKSVKITITSNKDSEDMKISQKYTEHTENRKRSSSEHHEKDPIKLQKSYRSSGNSTVLSKNRSEVHRSNPTTIKNLDSKNLTNTNQIPVQIFILTYNGSNGDAVNKFQTSGRDRQLKPNNGSASRNEQVTSQNNIVCNNCTLPASSANQNSENNKNNSSALKVDTAKALHGPHNNASKPILNGRAILSLAREGSKDRKNGSKETQEKHSETNNPEGAMPPQDPRTCEAEEEEDKVKVPPSVVKASKPFEPSNGNGLKQPVGFKHGRGLQILGRGNGTDLNGNSSDPNSASLSPARGRSSTGLKPGSENTKHDSSALPRNSNFLAKNDDLDSQEKKKARSKSRKLSKNTEGKTPKGKQSIKNKHSDNDIHPHSKGESHKKVSGHSHGRSIAPSKPHTTRMPRTKYPPLPHSLGRSAGGPKNYRLIDLIEESIKKG